MMNEIHYINTDLELAGPDDLRPLALALGAPKRLLLLSIFQREDGSWNTGLETFTEHDGPEDTICEFLDAVESLSPEAQSMWHACSSRDLNIGYECGTHPKEVSHGLSQSTLRRLAAHGLALRITLYPPTPGSLSESS
jgi:hypothetical protein